MSGTHGGPFLFRSLLLAGTAILTIPGTALAQTGDPAPQAPANSPADAAQQPASTAPQAEPSPTPAQPDATSDQSAIVVTGRRLDIARDAIAPALGASQYTFDRQALDKQPGGTNLTLNKSLLQAPGVVQDSYGVIHVRNEHGNLQYRLNGVIVPESISGFGTTFDQRQARSSSSRARFRRNTATAQRASSTSRPNPASRAMAASSAYTGGASAGWSRAR